MKSNRFKPTLIVMFLFSFLIFFSLSGFAQETAKTETETAKTETTKSEAEAAQPAPAIRWLDYQDGISKGKSERKKIFLNFYADWCHYCKVMAEDTFKNKKVVDYLNENFVSVRVDSDRERKIAAQYRVQGLPMTFFLKENGDNIGSQPGYIPPNMMEPLLKYIYTDSYQKMDFKTFLESM